MAIKKLWITTTSEEAQSSPAESNFAVLTSDMKDNGPVRICLITFA